MGVRFYHVGIVAADPLRLGRFYVEVFDCEDLGVRHDVSGAELAQGMGVPAAEIKGLDLRLPGFGEGGPILEIFSLADAARRRGEVAQTGLMHIAFSVDDVHATLDRVVAEGGSRLGDIAQLRVDGVGVATMVYARDPEGNVIEIQRWDRV